MHIRLVDVLALSGRMKKAMIFFPGPGLRHHIGLLAEQFDPQTSEHLAIFLRLYAHRSGKQCIISGSRGRQSIPDNYAWRSVSADLLQEVNNG
jgi:hypothetical protein